MQINRLLEIMYTLLQQKSITAGELAERLQVSKRTIYRDYDTLSQAGIPVYAEKGKGGGIRLMPEFVLSKSLFNEKEQIEILSALQGLSSVKTDETEQVLKKLSAIFNKRMANWLSVDFSDWSESRGLETGRLFSGLKMAILERRIIEFDYYSAYGEKTRRRIEPIQLWFKSKSWYIKGFCLTRQDMRTFKLTRIKNLTITEVYFSERNVPAQPPKSGSDRNTKREITLKLKVAPEAAYRMFDELDEESVEKQPDGGYIVSSTFGEDEWVYGFVLSFGEYVDVLEPEYIRDIIKEKAEKIAEKYRRDGLI